MQMARPSGDKMRATRDCASCFVDTRCSSGVRNTNGPPSRSPSSSTSMRGRSSRSRICTACSRDRSKSRKPKWDKCAPLLLLLLLLLPPSARETFKLHTRD